MFLSNVAVKFKIPYTSCTFDNVMVRNLYKRHNVDFILPYWCDTDVRTLVTLANIDTRDFPFKGIKHYGIDDCKLLYGSIQNLIRITNDDRTMQR
jgi:hypothetical protein